MAKYLDYDGLDRFLTKVKTLITAGDSVIDAKVANLATSIDNKLKYVFSLNDESKRITANTDLNDYKEPGVYVCTSNATAASLSNCPTSSAFVMVVQSVFGYYSSSGAWNSLAREVQLRDSTRSYRQVANSDGSGVYTFSNWSIIGAEPKTGYLTKVGNFDDGNPRYVRDGNVVRVYDDFRSLGLSNNDVMDRGLPRPLLENVGGALLGNDGNVYRCQVNSNGELVCKSSISNGVYLSVMLTYVTKD